MWKVQTKIIKLNTNTDIMIFTNLSSYTKDMTDNNSLPSNREVHDKMAIIENLIWEIAKIMEPNSYIDPEKIKRAKDALLQIFS